MVLKGICGGMEGLVPSAIIQENVPRLIGKVIVNVRVRVDLNMTLILSLDHMHPFLTLIVDLSQHFSSLFAKQLPIIMNDLKIFWPAAAGLERERVRLKQFLHLEKYYQTISNRRDYQPSLRVCLGWLSGVAGLTEVAKAAWTEVCRSFQPFFGVRSGQNQDGRSFGIKFKISWSCIQMIINQ